MAKRSLLKNAAMAVVASCALTLAGAAPAIADTQATVHTPGDTLNTRSGPGTDHAVTGTLQHGATVTITCTAHGTPVQGPWGTSTLWNKLASGAWVADAWIYTGTNGAVEGPCDDNGGTDPGGTGSITEIVGGANWAISQYQGPSDWSRENCWMYDQIDDELGLPLCSHPGIDIAIPRGTPLTSPVSGTVVIAGGEGGYNDDYNPAAGQLRIQLDNGDQVILGHASQIYVNKGDRVSVGQSVGASGSAGSGAHLHLEYRTPDSSTPSGQRSLDPLQVFPH